MRDRRQRSRTYMSVMHRMREMATQDYGGRLYENLPEIFARLNRDEKMLVLHVNATLYEATLTHERDLSMAEEDHSHHSSDPETHMDAVNLNQIEMVKLKSWLIRVAVLSLIAFVILFGVVVIVVENNLLTLNMISKPVHDLIEIFSMVFKT